MIIVYNMKMNASFYLLLVLCLFFTFLLVNFSLNNYYKEGMENNEKKEIVSKKKEKRVKTVSF
jgi:hypothetical protein